MSCQDSIEEQQENELEALKAIYDNDLRDLRGQSAWNRWRPLDIAITLTPLRGSSGLQEVHAKLDLHLICSENYPQKSPVIRLENSRGMSNEVLTELIKKLEDKAMHLVGEVMIFELCEYVKEFLYEHNKPATKSFYEEMVQRQQQQKLKEIKAQQLIQDRENEKMREEILQREEILKREHRRRKESRLNSETSNDSDSAHRRSSVRNNNISSNESSGDILLCSHSNTKQITFTNNGDICIIRGRCINHSDQKCVVFSGMDKDTGQLYIISEWRLNANSDRQISSIEHELNYLVKLNHQNLARYLNVFHENDNFENKSILYILKDFVFGLNCWQLYIADNISAENDILRHVAEGVLNALDFLHRNNVVHKDISASCVYIDRKGRIKLSNYSLNKRLSDLVCPSQTSNFSKKTDIYKFGLFMLSLVKGSIVDEENFEIPINISPDLYDFLANCLSSEDKSRYTASQLLNHKFLKVPLVRFSPQKNGEEVMPNRRLGSPEVPADINLLAHNTLSGQSRVEKEFEKLDHLGKGAYGDVYKVRNILDQRNYALKRIELNPRNRQLNKKIIREVKLLSRLNHENVVRYYNSWIETAVLKKDNLDSSTSTSVTSKESNVKELGFANDDSLIEKLAPPIRDVEWSISYGSKSKTKDESSGESSDDSDSDDDDDENWGLVLENLDNSDSILFERESDSDLSKSIDSVDNRDASQMETPLREIQFMYIQMEFCEKSTLRTAIDGDLYLDNSRVWRLFREIVEGLAHIHQQGMIHRDLKPMNIFLDYNDHVKIGDFGLATTNLLTRTNDVLISNKSYCDNEASQEQCADPSMTGHIGTALYVAPELTSTAKAVYNQKVDIYSLGIIFFEMSYKPLKTGMERINVITRLRSEKIVFPSDFCNKSFVNQEHIIRWLLDQNVSQRPTSQELLESDYIPPPVLEERELRELVRHTLSNPQLKAYKYLVESCFKQAFTAAQDITYDRDVSLGNTVKNIQLYNYIKETITQVFKLHGGQYLSTPLLMPKSQYYDSIDTCVKLMNHSGSVVTIPHDLRVPFARYVAWNGITSLRRYSIEKVYREKKVFGFIPRELYECAFDIVSTNPGNFMADAELLYILNEVIVEIPALKKRNFLIRLNHSLLLKAIFIHCGIKDKHNELYTVLSEAKEGKITKLQVRTHLISNGLSNNSISTLFNLLETEGTINKITSQLQTITKKKNTEASAYAKQALQELSVIINNAEALGVSFNIVVSLGLVYNVQQYSGMMCQLVCEVRKKQKIAMDVLAAGGRYDNMISKYRDIVVQAKMSNKDIKQTAVGISISLDKLISAMQKDQDNEANFVYLDVAVCSLGSNALLKEKSKVLKDLWSAGIRCTLIDATTLEEVQEQCNELKVPHVIILKDSEVKIRSWDRERFFEKKTTINELVENMLRILKTGNDSCSETSLNLSNQRSESKVFHLEQEVNVNINFLTSEKLLANNRKRLENQIRSQMDSVFKRLNGSVCVLVINLEIAVLKTMSAYLDFESEHEFNKSVDIVKEKHLRHKKYLNEICPEIYEQKSKRGNPVIVLYSCNDNLFRVLL